MSVPPVPGAREYGRTPLFYVLIDEGGSRILLKMDYGPSLREQRQA